jgi:2-oxoisovalerate dehydrogenase E1 component
MAVSLFRAHHRLGPGLYTIGSGHEGMAAVAAALRPTDMAFLHYRDAAFQIARAEQVPGQTIARDMLLSFASSAEDPISGGRHKVLGSRALMIPPQTSTIASHLPKAVGAAYFPSPPPAATGPSTPSCPTTPSPIAASATPPPTTPPRRAPSTPRSGRATSPSPCRCCSVARTTASASRPRRPPAGSPPPSSNRPGLKYFACDGLDLYDTYATALAAADYVRTRKKPAFLHVRTIRLYGHAGADMPTTYLPREEVEAEEANDPLLHFRPPAGPGRGADPGQALAIYTETADRVARVAAEAVTRPRLKTAAEVMAA